VAAAMRAAGHDTGRGTARIRAGGKVSISRRALVGFVAALVLWTAMALFWFVATPGEGHVCSLLQTPAEAGETEPPPLTDAELAELTRQRCDRPPSLTSILVFGTGYVVIIGVFAARGTRLAA
jgi:hypothetical protein